MSVEQVAMGFITVANETMCRPIRALTEARGHDTARHVLACFGGAGGQHACSIARSLGMSTVFIHRWVEIYMLKDVLCTISKQRGMAHKANCWFMWIAVKMLHSVHAPLKHALAVEVSLKWHTSHLSPCTQVNTHKTGFLCSLLIFSRRITLFVSSVFNPSHRVFSLGNKLFSTLFLFTQVKNQRHTSRGTLELTGIPFGVGGGGGRCNTP